MSLLIGRVSATSQKGRKQNPGDTKIQNFNIKLYFTNYFTEYFHLLRLLYSQSKTVIQQNLLIIDQ